MLRGDLRGRLVTGAGEESPHSLPVLLVPLVRLGVVEEVLRDLLEGRALSRCRESPRPVHVGAVGVVEIDSARITGDPIVVCPVPIDIKPQSCPNPINVKSRGVLPVAILGTAEFDVTTIDPASIR